MSFVVVVSAAFVHEAAKALGALEGHIEGLEAIHVESYQRTVFTILLCVADGCMEDVVAPLVFGRLGEPVDNAWLWRLFLALFFVFFAAYVTFGILNGYVVAVFGNEAASERERVDHRSLVSGEFKRALLRMWSSLDTSNDDSLEKEEFRALFDKAQSDKKVAGMLLDLGLTYHAQFDRVFDYLDCDGSGRVGVQEFVEGYVALKLDVDDTLSRRLNTTVRLARL